MVDIPQHKTGHTLTGYTLIKNHRDDLGRFGTVKEAQAHAQTLVDYPLAWNDNGKASDREWFADRTGDDYWLPLIGGYEKMIAHEKKHYLTPGISEENSQLMEELGHSAWWDRYYIEPDLREQTADIEGAEYIDATDHEDHAGWYVKPFGGRFWAVYNQRRELSALHVGLANTRAEALALAWKLRMEEERLYRKRRAEIDRRARRRAFFTTLFGRKA